MDGLIDIVITQTPQGETPEWVRRDWVGVVLRECSPPLPGYGVYGLVSKNRSSDQMGVLCSYSRAVEALRDLSPVAAKWFDVNVESGSVLVLAFRAGCYKVLPFASHEGEPIEDITAQVAHRDDWAVI